MRVPDGPCWRLTPRARPGESFLLSVCLAARFVAVRRCSSSSPPSAELRAVGPLGLASIAPSVAHEHRDVDATGLRSILRGQRESGDAQKRDIGPSEAQEAHQVVDQRVPPDLTAAYTRVTPSASLSRGLTATAPATRTPPVRASATRLRPERGLHDCGMTRDAAFEALQGDMLFSTFRVEGQVFFRVRWMLDGLTDANSSVCFATECRHCEPEGASSDGRATF